MTQEKATVAWTKDWPGIDDRFYWMRWLDGRYRDLPVHVQGIHVMCIFDHSYLQRGDLEGHVQFIGPITPAQFNERDQLLSEAAQLKRILNPIVAVYGLGLSPEKFADQVGPWILEARALLGKEG
jgi:hypothetical protein